MALTESAQLANDYQLPDFFLPEVRGGEQLSAATIAGPAGTVICFLCRHCPYVVHVLPEFARIATEYGRRGIAFAGISSNDAETYPADAPDKLREMAQGLPFPVLYDETQDVARSFGAKCTPEFFVFAPSGRLFYHGRMDGSTPGNNVPVTGSELRSALDDLLAGKNAPAPQRPGMGCNIKWK